MKFYLNKIFTFQIYSELLYKVRPGQKISEVRFLDFLCNNMITHGRKLLKNFEFLNFEFPCQSYGVFSFCCFLMVRLA